MAVALVGCAVHRYTGRYYTVHDGCQGLVRVCSMNMLLFVAKTHVALAALWRLPLWHKLVTDRLAYGCYDV